MLLLQFLPFILFVGATVSAEDEFEFNEEEKRRLTQKAKRQTYEEIILELTNDRQPQALVDFSEIMNSDQLSREERNEKLDAWGEKNNCEEAVGVFKIKEELIEEEEKKERSRIMDMFRSAAFQIKDIMQDQEMESYEKKEIIDTLVQTASEVIKPLLYSIYPSLLKEQLSSDEIISTPGQSYIDKIADMNEILTDIVYHRQDLTLEKKREEVEGFINQAQSSRVGSVLRLLWPKVNRKRRHLLKYHRKRHLRGREEDYAHTGEKNHRNRARRPTKVPPFYSKDFY